VVVLGIAGTFSARPIWRSIKTMRANGFIREAEEFARKDEWSSVFQRIRSALQLAPTDPDILRYAAQMHGRLGLEASMRFFDQLLATQRATTQDREEYAAVALRLGYSEVAWNQLEDLLEASNPSPHAKILGAQYYALKRQVPKALALARQSVQADPNNPTNSLTLANLLSVSTAPGDLEEALGMLRPVARTNGPFQLKALSAILFAPKSPRPDREFVEKLLSEMPDRSPEAQLLYADAQISIDPTQLNRVADEVIEKFGHGSSSEIAGAASWLNRHQLFGRSLEILLPDLSFKNETLFRLRYDALIGSGRTRDAYEFVLVDRAPGDALQLEFLRCNTAIKLKDDAAIESHLRSMIDIARKQPRLLKNVAEFAVRQKKRAIADEANQILSRNKREAVPAFQALLRSADIQGETWVARDYARKLDALKKDDASIKLQIAYYDLLLNENLESAATASETLHRAKPDDFNRRAVLALAYLRKNEPKEAGAIIEGQVVRWNRLTPGIRAVVVAAVGASGKTEVAAKLLRRVPIASLKPEERDLIRPYLLGDKAAESDELPTEDKPEKL
jgi:predicted Zn-dependent protease